MGEIIGVQGRAGIVKEASFGAGGVATTFIELINESLKDTIEKIPAPYVFGSRNTHKIYHGAHDVGGSFSMVVNPDNIGLLLFMALGVEANASQVVGTQAEVTEITCEADVSGSLSGEYITLDDPTTQYYAWFDVTGKGSVDPALAGKTGIIVTIAAGATANTVATALKDAIDAESDFGATVASAVVTVTNANNGAVADATNGDTGWSTSPNVTTQGSGGAAYDHVFTPAGATVDLSSFAMEVDKGENVCDYSGLTVNNMKFTAAKGALLTADFDVLGKQETDNQSFAAITPSTLKPYIFHHGTVKIATVAVTYVNSFNFTYGNELDAEGGFVLNGSDYRHHLYKQGGTLTGSMECEWTSVSDALRDAYLDNTQKKLEFIFTSAEQIEAGYYYTLTVEVPITHIMGDPPVISGRERVPFTVNFEAVYDATNFLKITHRDARTTKWSA